ncbi:hypothetical protein NDU88_010955 [Pleurodeles waltl]|uniref:Uncharacterized protein n=1 Tax=Pleurodeles waltl TaxID=8319 RepID=A0AAV7R1R6_PLEWA|nr:hypothetical protein NDU88_010955 [Pleurodeles waltl]
MAACRNAMRFSAVEDVKIDGLLFSRSVLQKELGFRPDQIDYLFAFPGCKVFEVIFTTFALFEQCLKRFKERNDSAPLKVFSINALTQPQKRWVNVSMFNEYVQSADIITWLNQFCIVSHGARVRDVDGVKTGYFKALVSLKRKPTTEELRHIPRAIRLGGATGTVFYPLGTVMDDSLYVTPKVFSTPSQHSLEPASSGTANAVGTQETVSTIYSTDFCSEIEYACNALEHSSFSDTAVAGEVVEWGKDDIFVEEEVESALDVSTSLKRNEKEGDDTEDTGFESNDSRDLCTQDDRRNFQVVTGEDAFTPVIKRKTKKRNRKLD